MYGIINKAIHQMILESYGKEAWEKISYSCECEQEGFLSSEPYSDDVTYGLVNHTAEYTRQSTASILIQLGEFWILNTGMKSYGSLLKAGGNNFMEFMLNLPNFHSRVMLIYPKIAPPEFEVYIKSGNTLILNYFSNRKGLTPFVEGLIRGLAKMHNAKINLKTILLEPDSKQKASFMIEIVDE